MSNNTLTARITRVFLAREVDPLAYRIEFSENTSLDNSWKYPIEFTYEMVNGRYAFINSVYESEQHYTPATTLTKLIYNSLYTSLDLFPEHWEDKSIKSIKSIKKSIKHIISAAEDVWASFMLISKRQFIRHINRAYNPEKDCYYDDNQDYSKKVVNPSEYKKTQKNIVDLVYAQIINSNIIPPTEQTETFLLSLHNVLEKNVTMYYKEYDTNTFKAENILYGYGYAYACIHMEKSKTQ